MTPLKGRMMTQSKVPFGLRDGVLFEPVNVPNGKACDCFCPGCGRPLIAYNQGKVRSTAYFGHQPGEDCPLAVESAVHLAAKDTLLRTRAWRKPALWFDRSGGILRLDAKRAASTSEWIYKQLIEPEGHFEYRAIRAEVDVKVNVKTPSPPLDAHDQLSLFGPNEIADATARSEEQVHMIRPDLKADHVHYVDWIEICVRHPVGPWKRELMQKAGMRVIEVNLHHLFAGPVSLSDVTRDVVDRVDNKAWLAHPDVRRYE